MFHITQYSRLWRVWGKYPCEKKRETPGRTGDDIFCLLWRLSWQCLDKQDTSTHEHTFITLWIVTPGSPWKDTSTSASYRRVEQLVWRNIAVSWQWDLMNVAAEGGRHAVTLLLPFFSSVCSAGWVTGAAEFLTDTEHHEEKFLRGLLLGLIMGLFTVTWSVNVSEQIWVAPLPATPVLLFSSWEFECFNLT